MTGSIRSICISVAAAALAVGLGACSQTTYGTGTSPGMQTLQDLAGIADFAGPSKPKIAYQPRPGVVAPPPGTPLPPPGSDQQAVAGNWPTDPDVQAKKLKEQAAALEKYCADRLNKIKPECRDPGWRLPASATADNSRAPSQILLNQSRKAGDMAHSTAEQNAEAVKLFAEAKGQVAVDSSGNPVRRYLTDPPSAYRIPDPNAPVVFEKKKKTNAWHWPWEKSTPAADNLTPASTTASTTPPG